MTSRENSGRRIIIIGAGITGLTTAYTLAKANSSVAITVLEATDHVGGLIKTSPFAGLPAIDEAADAFLTRSPWAVALTDELGLTSADMVVPATGSAYVWHKKMYTIPQGLLLGIPGEIAPLVKTGLISPLGKLRASIEPLLPATKPGDSIGRLVRARFGNEVHEYLVDPLIGSIYSADTDNFSIEAVPQISDLFTRSRSLLLGVRKQHKVSTTMTFGSTPGIFAAPRMGMGSLINKLTNSCRELGVGIVTDAAVRDIEPGFVIHSDIGTFNANAVVVASPARQSAAMFQSLDVNAYETFKATDHVGVIMVTLRVPSNEFPTKLTGSGYLVPKRDQTFITATSFASNKWSHWNPADGSKILRISLGRDGVDVQHLSDDEVLLGVLADLKRHTGVAFTPLEVRISRWDNAFPQYRPGHFSRLAAIEESLAATAPGLILAGASHRGIGIPACVQQARAASAAALQHMVRHTP